MTINKIIHNEHAIPPQIKNSLRYENRIGFWADVVEVDSRNNCCTVINDQGLKLNKVQVSTREWIVKQNENNYAASERILPPVGCRVFVLVPNSDIGSAFILCSGYPLGEKNTQILWTDDNASQEEIQKKNNIGEKITQGGWNFREYYANGNTRIENNDKTILFEVYSTDDSEDDIEKKLKLTAWNNSVEFTENGFSFKDTNQNKIEYTDNGIVITDLNNNKIELTDKGIKITDKNSNKIDLASTGIKMSDGNGNTLETSSSGVSINNGSLEISMG